MFDMSEVDELAAGLASQLTATAPLLTTMMRKAGSNIKDVMREDASGHRFLPGLAATVDYDLFDHGDEVTIDVGFNKVGQGNLAVFAAYWSVNNAPVMDITRGLEAELPNVVAWLGKIANEALA